MPKSEVIARTAHEMSHIPVHLLKSTSLVLGEEFSSLLAVDFSFLLQAVEALPQQLFFVPSSRALVYTFRSCLLSTIKVSGQSQCNQQSISSTLPDMTEDRFVPLKPAFLRYSS